MAAPSESFVATISEAIQAAGVPCVLWGHCLLNIHGIPSIIGSVDYIVPDGQLQRAIKALRSLNRLEQCRDTDSCPSGPHDRYTQPASFHVRIDGSEIAVGIYVQSETLWFLPELDQSLLRPQTLALHPHFVFASDKETLPPGRPGRGAGVFQNSEPPVIVPRAIVLLEAFVRLYARDCEKQVGGCSMQMIAYVEEYVDEDGYLNGCRLPEPLQGFYEELKVGAKPVSQWTKELREALGVRDDGIEHQQRKRDSARALSEDLRV